MAGDWMKVDLTLPDKPEVIGMADMLGIHEDEVVGKMIRFWRWCDQHLKDCHAQNVTLSFLDRYLGVTGMGQAMCDVGWLVVVEDGLLIPNFDRHLSQGSKQRALASERKRKQRSEMSRAKRDTSVTREEKRREEKKESKPKKPRATFQKPTVEQVQQYAREHNYQIDAQAFWDYYEANGWMVGRNPMRDWKAAVRQWQRRQGEFARPGRNGKPEPTEEQVLQQRDKRLAQTQRLIAESKAAMQAKKQGGVK